METDKAKIAAFLEGEVLEGESDPFIYIEREGAWIKAMICDGCGADEGYYFTSELDFCDRCRKAVNAP